MLQKYEDYLVKLNKLNNNNSDDYLSLRKTLKICNVVILIRSVFNNNNKYYSQVILEEYINCEIVFYVFE